MTFDCVSVRVRDLDELSSIPPLDFVFYNVFTTKNVESHVQTSLLLHNHGKIDSIELNNNK